MTLPSIFSADRLKKLFHEGTHPHPVRDWFVIVGVSAVLVGLSVGWNTWTYIQASTETKETGEVTETAVFDVAAVETVQRTFEERSKEAERYRSSYHFVDPSL